MTTYNSIGGQYNPYTTSPSTAHIDWTINQYMGGVAGESQVNPGIADWNYYNAPTYQPYWVPPMVMDGRLYYLERQVPGNGFVGMYCVDLKTGKPIWFQPISVIGQAGAGGG